MEENKYYTPTIDEFYVGFECESNYCLFSKSYDKWEKISLTEDNISYMLDSYVCDAYDTEFRVKYLDREDIESLGFVYEDNVSNNGLMFRLDDYMIYYWSDSLRVCVQYKYSKYVFDGFIKNKSELKKLLKQLGIDGGDNKTISSEVQ